MSQPIVPLPALSSSSGSATLTNSDFKKFLENARAQTNNHQQQQQQQQQQRPKTAKSISNDLQDEDDDDADDDAEHADGAAEAGDASLRVTDPMDATDTPTVEKQQQRNARSESYQRWQARKAELAEQRNAKTKYRDRARERREDKLNDYEDSAHVDLTSISYEASKFLGGDMEHTHLVKGLDYALLAKFQEEQDRREEAQFEQALQVHLQQNNNNNNNHEEQNDRHTKRNLGAPTSGGFDLEIHSPLGAHIYTHLKSLEEEQQAMILAHRTAVSQQNEKSTALASNFIPTTSALDLFYPGRMVYEFQLPPTALCLAHSYQPSSFSHIPTTILTSKYDLTHNASSATAKKSQADKKTTSMVPPHFLQRLSQMYIRLEEEKKEKKEKKKKEREEKSGSQSSSLSSHLSSTSHMADDDDDMAPNIQVGQTSEQAISKLQSKFFKPSSKEPPQAQTTATQPTPSSINDEPMDKPSTIPVNKHGDDDSDDDDIFAGVGTKLDDDDDDYKPPVVTRKPLPSTSSSHILHKPSSSSTISPYATSSLPSSSSTSSMAIASAVKVAVSAGLDDQVTDIISQKPSSSSSTQKAGVKKGAFALSTTAEDEYGDLYPDAAYDSDDEGRSYKTELEELSAKGGNARPGMNKSDDKQFDKEYHLVAQLLKKRGVDIPDDAKQAQKQHDKFRRGHGGVQLDDERAMKRAKILQGFKK